MDTIKHYDNCNHNYPEKNEIGDEQQITKIEIGDNEVVWQCVDCGAFVIEKEED